MASYSRAVVGASLACSGTGGERYLGVIYMINNPKLLKFLYSFEGKFLFYIPVRGMFDHLSIVMQPVLEPDSRSFKLWHKIIPGQMNNFAVCVELLTRPRFTSQLDQRVHDPSWAPHIKLVNWNPRDAPVTLSTYAWNFAMILIGTHRFSQNFGSYSALWKDCQTFVRYIVPHFQGERSKGGLEGKRIDTREKLDLFLLQERCTLNTVDTDWARQGEDGLCSSNYFCYVSLSPVSHPELVLTTDGVGAVTLQPASEEARDHQQFYLDYSIGTGHCTLSTGPGLLIGSATYEVGAHLACGAKTPSTKFLSRNVEPLDGGHSKLKLHLVTSSKKGSATTHTVDSSLVLSYTAATRTVDLQKAVTGSDSQMWIMSERQSTQIPSCPGATLVEGAEYQLSPVSEPDSVLTFDKNFPLLSFRLTDIEQQQTFRLRYKTDTHSWIITTTTKPEHALDVVKSSTRRGDPIHFWKKVHAKPNQQFQIFRYGEPSETGVQQVLIIVQHSKLYLKANGAELVQDQCLNPPLPCFLWNLIPMHAASASSS